MADAAQVKLTAEKLGPDAAANGWDDTRIGADLDNNLTPNQIALAWWSYWLANCSNLVDVSESGSSRSLSQTWAHAQAMVTMYQGLVNLDNPPINPKGRLRSYPIRRV